MVLNIVNGTNPTSQSGEEKGFSGKQEQCKNKWLTIINQGSFWFNYEPYC